jgi:hypothetical protein
VQGWDRFAYTNNNPVRYTDPTGHCIGPVAVYCGAGLVFSALVVVGITALIYSTPQMQELGQQAKAGIENAVQMAKSGLPSWKHRKAQASLNTLNYQADDINGNGPKLEGCKNPDFCLGLAVITAYTIYKIIKNKIECNALEDESCGSSQSSIVQPGTQPSTNLDQPLGLPPADDALLPLYPPLELTPPPAEVLSTATQKGQEPIQSINSNWIQQKMPLMQ